MLYSIHPAYHDPGQQRGLPKTTSLGEDHDLYQS